MAKILVDKQEIIEQALDSEIETPVIPTEKEQRAATESISREKVEREAATMTQERIGAILRGLQLLTAMDSDHARDLNGMGFSKADSFIGQRLAGLSYMTPKQAVLGAKLVNRYRKQLPAEVTEAARA